MWGHVTCTLEIGLLSQCFELPTQFSNSLFHVVIRQLKSFEAGLQWFWVASSEPLFDVGLVGTTHGTLWLHIGVRLMGFPSTVSKLFLVSSMSQQLLTYSYTHFHLFLIVMNWFRKSKAKVWHEGKKKSKPEVVFGHHTLPFQNLTIKQGQPWGVRSMGNPRQASMGWQVHRGLCRGLTKCWSSKVHHVLSSESSKSAFF